MEETEASEEGRVEDEMDGESAAGEEEEVEVEMGVLVEVAGSLLIGVEEADEPRLAPFLGRLPVPSSSLSSLVFETLWLRCCCLLLPAALEFKAPELGTLATDTIDDGKVDDDEDDEEAETEVALMGCDCFLVRDG